MNRRESEREGEGERVGEARGVQREGRARGDPVWDSGGEQGGEAASGRVREGRRVAKREEAEGASVGCQACGHVWVARPVGMAS